MLQSWKCSTRDTEQILAKDVEGPDLHATATHRSQPVPQERELQLGRGAKTKTKMTSKQRGNLWGKHIC